jgi:uncharacterized protein YqjF (DUF2071 family)
VIDRLAPARRPDGAADGHQRWRKLLFAHWAVPAELVRPLVPAALELDLFEGVLYVGVVPFVMEEVRPSWLPRFASFDFLETNVRTYVVHDGKPGVYFLSLEAASWLACTAARASFGLPYYWAKMRRSEEADVVDYRTDRRLGGPAKTAFRYRVGDELPASEPGSLQHFLVERYYLFVEKGGAIHRGQVHHVPYPVRAAEVLDVEEGLIERAGLPRPIGRPVLAHYSEGVDVEVFGLQRCS